MEVGVSVEVVMVAAFVAVIGVVVVMKQAGEEAGVLLLSFEGGDVEVALLAVNAVYAGVDSGREMADICGGDGGVEESDCEDGISGSKDGNWEGVWFSIK